jgi:hypothetical protein
VVVLMPQNNVNGDGKMHVYVGHFAEDLQQQD